MLRIKKYRIGGARNTVRLAMCAILWTVMFFPYMITRDPEIKMANTRNKNARIFLSAGALFFEKTRKKASE